MVLAQYRIHRPAALDPYPDCMVIGLPARAGRRRIGMIKVRMGFLVFQKGSSCNCFGGNGLVAAPNSPGTYPSRTASQASPD
jgi:hypothetical protein